MFKRVIEDKVKEEMFKGKLQIIYGPRQVGKTTLAKKIIEDSGLSYRFLRGDDEEVKKVLSYPSKESIVKLLTGVKVILLDEAQVIPNIGTTLKLFYDLEYIKETQLIVTGSSSFDLKNSLMESMTGRYFSYTLYPLSVGEVSGIESNYFYEMKVAGKENFALTYGFYPETFMKDKFFVEEKLKTIVESTLYKDVFVMEGIKKPEVLNRLVKILAINISQTVTVGGLAKMANTSSETIRRYLDLLEKTFVIRIHYSFSRNLNNELKRAMKIYFIDIGFRNSVLQNFSNYDVRTDIGQVFENFWVMERVKFCDYNRIYSNKYFWQTYNDVEIDYLEERNGELNAFECKLEKRNSRGVKIFEEEYKKERAKVHMVTRENYLDFLTTNGRDN